MLVLLRSDAVLVAWAEARPVYLVILAAPALGVLWVQGKIFQRSCRELGVEIGEREALALAVLTTAGNYVGALRLGVVAKALYIKRARGVSITETVAMTLGGAATGLLTSTACGLFLVLCLPIGRTPTGLLAMAAVLLAAVILVSLLGARHATMRGLVERYAPLFMRARLLLLLDAWQVLRRPQLLLALVAWQVVGIGMAALGFYIGFNLLLDSPIDVFAALAFTTLTGLASLAALTPGNVGFQELLIVAMAQSFQVGEGAAVVVAAALRLVQIVLIALLSPLAWLTLRGHLENRNPPLDGAPNEPGVRNPSVVR